jgi:purine nucleoside phosphorylase
MGLRVLVLSLVSNPAAGVVEGPLVHEEVLASAARAGESVRRLLTALLADPELL